MEYPFPTGDHVDVLFEGPEGHRAVVEIEIQGEDNLVVGVHQAVKYRTLAATERDLPIHSRKIRAILVAYETGYPRMIEMADKYDVDVFAFDPTQFDKGGQ